MSGSYAVGNNYLSFTVGSAGAAGTGAFSIVALVNPGVGNNNAGFVGLYASATQVRSIGEAGNGLYGTNDFSPSGFGTLTQGNWYVVAVTKSSSTVPWRMHYWAWNSTPSGSFSHGVATSAANQGNGSAITENRIGANGINANGLIAAVGVWTVELTDGQIDTLVSANLSSWSALSPAELISLENWNGTSGATVPVGTSAFSATTGTVSSGANPSGFNFSIGSSGAAPAGLAVPLALGTPTVALNRTAAPTGLAIPIALGAPTVALGRTAAPTGLAVPLALGQPVVSLNRSAAPAGLAIPLALGAPAAALNRSVAPAGLAVPLTLGSPAAGAQAPYVTAVLTTGAQAAAVLTASGGGSTMIPGAAAPATLTAGTL